MLLACHAHPLNRDSVNISKDPILLCLFTGHPDEPIPLKFSLDLETVDTLVLVHILS